jgi:hypothetical protein
MEGISNVYKTSEKIQWYFSVAIPCDGCLWSYCKIVTQTDSVFVLGAPSSQDGHILCGFIPGCFQQFIFTSFRCFVILNVLFRWWKNFTLPIIRSIQITRRQSSSSLHGQFLVSKHIIKRIFDCVMYLTAWFLGPQHIVRNCITTKAVHDRACWYVLPRWLQPVNSVYHVYWLYPIGSRQGILRQQRLIH